MSTLFRPKSLRKPGANLPTLLVVMVLACVTFLAVPRPTKAQKAKPVPCPNTILYPIDWTYSPKYDNWSLAAQIGCLPGNGSGCSFFMIAVLYKWSVNANAWIEVDEDAENYSNISCGGYTEGLLFFGDIKWNHGPGNYLVIANIWQGTSKAYTTNLFYDVGEFIVAD